MSGSAKTSTLIVLSGLLGLVSMGASSCSQPKEYCKFYATRADQAECTDFCERDSDFEEAVDREDTIKACQLGQFGYLSNVRVSAAEALLACDRHFQGSDAFDRACRAGVAAEELRVSKSGKGPGTSNDRDGGRETGNGR